MYHDLEYWVCDKEHQGITQIEYGPQWKVFIDARMSIARRAGVIDGAPKKVFKIGCSEGILLREPDNQGHEALGCEMNKPTAEARMAALGVKIKTSLFENLDLAPGYYDLAVSFHTVERLPDLHRVFGKIASILKSDGALLIEVPAGPEEYTNPDHFQFFSDESLKRLLETYFDVGEIIPNINAERLSAPCTAWAASQKRSPETPLVGSTPAPDSRFCCHSFPILVFLNRSDETAILGHLGAV